MAKPELWLDFETGGVDPMVHSPLSFAMEGYDSNGNALGCWDVQIRIQPLVVEPQALKINKIDPTTPGIGLEEFKNGYFRRLNDWFYNGNKEGRTEPMIRPYAEIMPLVCGHNTSGFDNLMLKRLLGDWVGAITQGIDTMVLAATLRQWGIINPENIKLGTLLAYFDISPLEGELHTALTDIRGCKRLNETMKGILNGSRYSPEIQAALDAPGAFDPIGFMAAGE